MKLLKKLLKENLNRSPEESKEFSFSNGIRLVYKQVEGTQTTQMGFVVNVGSRDDGVNEGMAHCFEHMLFRGTKSRTSTQIINRLETIGGELNAFTAKDITVVYATVLTDYFSRTIDLLSDIVFNSEFTEDALAKERNIIREEINMYLDTPEEYIYDEFQYFHYPNHPMGYNILGSEASLSKIDIEVLNKFYHAHYIPRNMVLSVVSDLPFEKVIKKCLFLESMDGGVMPIKDVLPIQGNKGFNIQNAKDFNLAYACLGTEAYNHFDDKRYNLMLLNNILGGPGMNSKLNMSIREKYGLTYQIDSSFVSYDNTGLFYINFATEISQLNKTLKLIKKELLKLTDKPLGPMQLVQAKHQFINQLRMAEESKNAMMIYQGKSLLLYNKVESLDFYLSKMSALTANDLYQTAKEVFDYHSLSQLIFVPED